jgi:NAD(P)-dependent dehydrogenase (short-subunit alcohol dehydrogenase family)
LDINGKKYKINPDSSSGGEKIAIVTGANSGIGIETALGLAKAGVTVVLTCRSQKKADDAIKRIKRELAEINVKCPELVGMVLDLTDFKLIEEFAREFRSKFNRLDIFVQNAGIVNSGHQVTDDGKEYLMTANHLGHFYLTVC